MKKTILLLLCMAMLTGCTSTKPESSTSTAESAVPVAAAEATAPYADTVDSDWINNGDSYKTFEEFLADGAGKMNYYDAATQQKYPITPYEVNYDKDKYTLLHIIQVDEYKYTYVLTDNDGNSINISFFYIGGVNEIDDVYLSETKQKINVDFQGKEDTEALFEKAPYHYSVKVIPGANCEMTVKYYLNADTASTFSASSASSHASALLSDFTISEASIATTEDSAAPVADCEWEDNSKSYATREEFFSEGIEEMYYLEAGTQKQFPVTPYKLTFNEEKYEFVQIMRNDFHMYTYILRDKKTNEDITVEFLYSQGISTIDDIYQKGTQRETTEFNGNPDAEVLIGGTIHNYYAKAVAGEDCSVYLSKHQSDKNAKNAYDNNITLNELAMEFIKDFTITKA